MILNRLIKKFAADDSGAVTPEFIAMGGVIVVLGVFAVAGIIDGVEELDQDRGYQLREQDKVTTF